MRVVISLEADLDGLAYAAGTIRGYRCYGRAESRTTQDVPLVEFIMDLIFTRMLGDSCRRRFRSLVLCPLLYI